MGYNMFDQYSLVHFSTGVLAYFCHIPLIVWLILHTLFEILECSKVGIEFSEKYLTFLGWGKYEPDNLINTIGDTISTLLGWLCAYLIDYYGTKYKWYTLKEHQRLNGV